MDDETAERLIQLNKGFYAAFAGDFAASRPASDPALARILPHIPQRARVLDLGCGNGRLAELLDGERAGTSYVGVDAVEELLKIARRRSQGLSNVSASYHLLDLSAPDWSRPLRGDAFDCVLALAVLHHVPAWERRAGLLKEARALLSPRGKIVVSVWQFLDSERMRRKIRPWSEAGLSAARVDAGDYLLDWRRGGRGLRYCHLVDDEEMERLAADAGLTVRESFRAGGREGNLSLFAVMQ